jgi:hypothetical protein
MDDFSELETELKQLRPRPASVELTARIEVALAEQTGGTATAGVLPQRKRFRLNWFSVALGTAAAGVVLLARVGIDQASHAQQRVAATTPSISPSSSPTMAAPRSFMPDGLTRVVYHRHDEGLHFRDTTSTPVRRVRSQVRETLQWKEAGTGASLRVSYPTEEVELIPVSGQ